VTFLLIALYAFFGGLYLGEARAERRAKKAVAAHDAIRDAARKVLDARRFVGAGPVISNRSEWTLGKDRFIVQVEPLEEPSNQLARSA
jgi:hypothetical protein